ncbi:MAG: hypothetical protein JKY70_18930 [Mucilaginibacter sp.]|nr:hypothetical protein [Mucilaginibacter sp.]
MKKILYVTFAALAFAGCKKDKPQSLPNPKPSAVAQKVSFDVNDFGMTAGNLKTNGITNVNGLKDHIKYLRYAVLNWQEANFTDLITTLYRYQEHISSETNFGQIRDSLDDGRYHICFIGSDVLGKVDVETIPFTGGNQLPHPAYRLDYKSLTTNIFSAYVDTTIAGKPVDKPIVLKRAVSQLTVHMNDAIPANAAKFVITFTDYPLGLDLVTGNGIFRGRQDEYTPDATFEFSVSDAVKGKTGMEITSIVWPYDYPKITVDCLDGQGKVIAQAILPKNYNNLYDRLDPNTQYKFSGNLFGRSANFSVTVDTKWGTPVNTPFSLPSKTQHIN